jgi:hypothetical protein
MSEPSVSVTAQRLYTALTPFVVGDEDQGWPLLLLCSVIMAAVADVEAFAGETDTQVGWGPLLDPAVCPARALPFLGQMVGAVVPVGSDEATARQIVTHSPGFARGTPASILAAARLWLTGGMTVALDERFGGSAYAIRLTVFASEVIDLDALTAAVKAALPAGFSLTVAVIEGWTIAEMESETTTIAAVESDWATYKDFEQQIP